MLTVRLLGPPLVERDGQPLRIARRKSRGLIYYLAAHTGPLSRDQLLALLWIDLDRSPAHQVLRTTLYGLHKALGSDLELDEDRVALSPQADVDLRQFERDLASPPDDPQALAAILDRYRGEFLEGFSLPDATAFEDWASLERERLQRLMIRGLTALSRRREASADHAGALEALDRALRFDPLQEDLQRDALRLHYMAGDRAGAIRRYEHLRRLLDDEMGVPPMAETRSLYDAIITDALPRIGSASTPSTTRTRAVTEPAPLPFLGREAELRGIEGAVRAGKLVVIEGEPGIGKTRLAQEYLRRFLAARPDAGPIALAGTAHELEQAFPYQPMIDALRSVLELPGWPSIASRLDLPPIWRTEAARLVPELSDTPALPVGTAFAADEPRLWEGVHRFLASLAREHPTLVFIDDLHWADASTIGLLGYLARQDKTGVGRLSLIAAAQPPRPRSALETILVALTREARVERLALPRLSDADVLAIAKHLSPSQAEPLADWLMQGSEGIPYFLSEMVRSAQASRLLQADGRLDMVALADATRLPPTVYALIQARLSRLSDRARRVLDAAVAAGREFEFDVIARAAGMSEAAVLDALDELLAAGLLLPKGGLRYAFDHSLTMEVAYQEGGEPRHRSLHRRVAEAIESLYRGRLESVTGPLAFHFQEGGESSRGAPYALKAGRQAEAVAAWPEAIALYQQAAAGAAFDDLRFEAWIALGGARLRAGEAAAAAEAYRQALSLAQAVLGPEASTSARLALGQALLPQGRFEEAIALAQEVLRSEQPSAELDAEFLWGAALSLEGRDLRAAADHLERARALCDSDADPARGAHILFELGSVAAQRGDLPAAIALYQEALDVASRTDLPEALPWRILAHNNLAYHMLLLGDPAAAEHAHLGFELAQDKGALALLPYLQSTLGEIALAQGDLNAAESHFQDGLVLAERLALPERIAGLTANLGLVASRRGKTSVAIHLLSAAQARADVIGVQHLAAQIRIWLVSLLPPDEAKIALAQAHRLAEQGHRGRLMAEVQRLEADLGVAR